MNLKNRVNISFILIISLFLLISNSAKSTDYNLSIVKSISLESIFGTQSYIITGYDFYEKFIIISTKDGHVVAYDQEKETLKSLGFFSSVFSVWDMGLNAIKVDNKSNRLYFHTQFNYGSYVEFKVGYFPIYVENDQIFLNLPEIKIVFSKKLDIAVYVHAGAVIHQEHNGNLLIGIGDYGPFENPKNVQNLDFINGKILRMDRDGNPLEDNPFYDGTDSNRSYVYAWGFRNPFEVGYDEYNDKLYVSDIGLIDREEVSLIKKNKNYGWPVYEGDLHKQTEVGIEHEEPLLSWGRDLACAITGLEVNHFENENSNSLLVLDYCSGALRKFDLITKEFSDIFNFGTKKFKYKMKFDNNLLYVGSPNIIVVLENNVPKKFILQPKEVLFSSFDETVEISFLTSTQKDLEKYIILNGNKKIYEGQLNAVKISVSTIDKNLPIKILAVYADEVIESFPIGIVQINSQRPIIEVTFDGKVCDVNDKAYYNPGDVINFNVLSYDLENQAIPFSSKVIFHHDDHTHHVQDYLDNEFKLTIPESSEKGRVYYEILVETEKDQFGLNNKLSTFFYPEPEIKFESSKLNKVLCSGEEITFKASGFSSFSWIAGDIELSFSDSLTLNPTINSTYKIVARDEEGCFIKEQFFSVNVHPIPTLDVQSDKIGNEICDGEEITFFASGYSYYSWKENGVEIETSSSLTLSPRIGATYSIMATDNEGCYFEEKIIPVNIIPKIPDPPVIQFSKTKSDPKDLLITQYLKNIIWYKGLEVVSYDSALLVTENGTYYAKYVFGECQSDISDPFKIVVTDISDLVNEIIVYPNPVKGNYLKVSIPHYSKLKEINYHLYSQTGALLISGEIYKEFNRIDISSLNKGLYILKVIINGNVRTIKILI